MKYFTGDNLGSVKAATTQDFKALVNRYIDVAVTIPVTRAQYHAMTKNERNEVKKVSYLCPATFPTSPSPRRSEHAQACNLIFLDIDEGNDGSLPALPLVNNPEVLAQQLAPFAWAAYHTASSTPTKPRCRIMVAANGIAPEDYPAAVRTIAKRIGLASTTRESLVAIQAMYLPSLFVDQDSESEHPSFASELEGREFSSHDIDGSVALPTETHKRTNKQGNGGEDDLLLFLRPPVQEITIEIVRDALEHLDPDCDYRDWLEVAAALRHQFTDPIEEAEAYDLFDVWSSAGQKYQGTAETRAKFESFSPNASGRVPVTIRSVLHKATNNGWHNGEAKDKCFRATQKWASEVESGSTLLGEGLKRILTTPMLTQSEEEALLNHIAIQAKRRFSLQVSITALRKDLNALRNQHKAREMRDVKSTVPGWVKGVCYVASTQEFFRHHTGEKFRGEAFDDVYSRKLLPTEEQLKSAGATVTQAAMAKPWIKPTDYALNLVKIPTATDYDYIPSAPGEVFVCEAGKTYVNTYVRCHPLPEAERAEIAGAAILKHFENLFEDPKHRTILMDYLAFQVQFPGIKCRWSALIQGAKGCGKTFLSDLMGVVLGQRHVFNVRGEALFSAYNEWATGYQFVAFEEVRVQGHSRYEVMNGLKPLVSNTRISVAQKFRDVREVVNRTNYIMFTNHHDSLVVTEDERRYFVLKSRIQTLEQVEELRKDGYFSKLYQILAEDAGGLRAFFESWEISSDFEPNGPAPSTKYLSQLMQDSANETTEAVRRLTEEGDNPLVREDMVSGKVLLELLHNVEGLRKVSPQYLASVLRDEGFEKVGGHRLNGDRHYLWVKRSANILDPASLAALRLTGEDWGGVI